jgi:hypothetical protein
VSATDVLAAIAGIQATVIVAVVILLGRTRERLVKLEEWVRLHEKRLNGM